MYGTDPFSAQHATGDTHSGAPSIFGALPYPRSTSIDPPVHTLVSFRFVASHSQNGGRPSVLESTVFGPNNEIAYRITTTRDASAGSVVTLLQAIRAPGPAQTQTIALVEWRSHPAVQIRGLAAKQPVGQWLRLSSDGRSRMMVHGGVHYSWAPVDRFLQLFAPGSSEWLGRVTKHYDVVVLELTTRAIELGLMDITVLATSLLQSGMNID